MLTLKTIVFGILFVISSGIVLARFFRETIVLALLAGMVAGISLIILIENGLFSAPPSEEAPLTQASNELKMLKTFRDILKDGGLGPEMVVIPMGIFQMGSNYGSNDEKPVHTVAVKDFALAKYEVTRGEFRQFVNATDYITEAEKGDGCYGWSGQQREKRTTFNWRQVGFAQDDNYPVICVSWHDAQAYTQWLSAQTGQHYLLPSEAEWEYACLAGSVGKYSFGNDAKQLPNYAWYGVNSSGKTHPVGEKKPNLYGLYDIHGNVWEWNADNWHEDYNDAPSQGIAWINTEKSDRYVLRGSSWYNNDFGLHCADRYWGHQTDRDYNWGFRVAKQI
jgi:formylglycine-generating enzyme required for sulfatase activity